MKTLREQLEYIWRGKIVNPLRLNKWRLSELTGLPAAKKTKKSLRQIDRLAKPFSWRKSRL